MASANQIIRDCRNKRPTNERAGYYVLQDGSSGLDGKGLDSLSIFRDLSEKSTSM